MKVERSRLREMGREFRPRPGRENARWATTWCHVKYGPFNECGRWRILERKKRVPPPVQFEFGCTHRRSLVLPWHTENLPRHKQTAMASSAGKGKGMERTGTMIVTTRFHNATQLLFEPARDEVDGCTSSCFHGQTGAVLPPLRSEEENSSGSNPKSVLCWSRCPMCWLDASGGFRCASTSARPSGMEPNESDTRITAYASQCR